MTTALILIFIIAYTAIALEHPLKINKSASALIAAGLLWSIYAMSSTDVTAVGRELSETVGSTAQIIFFLIGAMTIVEVIDTHNGFEVITSKIKTQKLSALMWLIGFVTFFLSAILDNLTTTIVMVSLLRKLLDKQADRLYFAGIIVIAANAGGAWSPIGDVTTTMLWIGGQITALNIVTATFIPSVINLLIPLCIAATIVRGQVVISPQKTSSGSHVAASSFEQHVMLYLGLGVLLAVPAFKTVTHLPPFIGILFGLGFLWLVGDLIHKNKTEPEKNRLAIARALMRIDMATIVFFIGILLAVAALEHAQILHSLANWLEVTVGRQDMIIMLIGMASAIVDNVPLVAASMGMYSLEQNPADTFIWEFLAYCAGTGGSLLIIGSAAGVTAMGLEKINFIWYMKKFTVLAFFGYIAGAIAYIVQFKMTH